MWTNFFKVIFRYIVVSILLIVVIKLSSAFDLPFSKKIVFRRLEMSTSRIDTTSLPGLKFLTYNIDGLNTQNLNYRTNCILGMILSERAHVVQLQEVVPDTAIVIISTMLKNGYKSFHESDNPSSLGHYFTLTFVRLRDEDSGIDLAHSFIKRVPFSGSLAQGNMNRNMLQLHLHWCGREWLFINCHLESCGAAFKSPESSVRVAQLSQGLTALRQHSMDGKGPAVLAGDLNIREAEAKHVLQLVQSQPQTTGTTMNSRVDASTSGNVGLIKDVSEVLEGKRKSATWYMPLNPGAPPPPYEVKARYDRIYYCQSYNVPASEPTATSRIDSIASSTSNAANTNPDGGGGCCCFVTPTSFKLIGSDEILDASDDAPGDPSTYRTPSDHRGIVTTFYCEMKSTCDAGSSTSSGSKKSSSSSYKSSRKEGSVQASPATKSKKKLKSPSGSSNSNSNTINSNTSNTDNVVGVDTGPRGSALATSTGIGNGSAMRKSESTSTSSTRGSSVDGSTRKRSHAATLHEIIVIDDD